MLSSHISGTSIYIRSISYQVHACGVRVDIFQHGALGICKSSVCLHLRSWTSVRLIRIFFYFSLWTSVASGGSRPRIEAPCTAVCEECVSLVLVMYQVRGTITCYVRTRYQVLYKHLTMFAIRQQCAAYGYSYPTSIAPEWIPRGYLNSTIIRTLKEKTQVWLPAGSRYLPMISYE